jgi:hypothetical protein
VAAGKLGADICITFVVIIINIFTLPNRHFYYYGHDPTRRRKKSSSATGKPTSTTV